MHVLWRRLAKEALKARNRLSFRVGSAVQEGICDVLLGIPGGGQGPERAMVKHCAEDIGYEYLDENLKSDRMEQLFSLTSIFSSGVFPIGRGFSKETVAFS